MTTSCGACVNASAMRYKMRLIRKQEAGDRDVLGGYVGDDDNVVKTFIGSLKRQSGREQYKADHLQESAKYKIETWWFPDLQTSDFIQYDEKNSDGTVRRTREFRIVGIPENPNEMNRFWIITVEEGTGT